MKKISCDCGRVVEPRMRKIKGFEIEALVCRKCGFVTLTKDQAKFLMIAPLQTLSE